MSLIIVLAIVVQLALLLVIVRVLGLRSMSGLGFQIIAASFIYHGICEISVAAFPGAGDAYRVLVDADIVTPWILLVTATMCLFTITYLHGVNRLPKAAPAEEIIANIDDSILFRWPVLLAISLPSFFLVMLGDQSDSGGGYWLSGLSNQFTLGLITVGISVASIRSRGRWYLLLLSVSCLAMAAAGEKMLVLHVGILRLPRC